MEEGRGGGRMSMFSVGWWLLCRTCPQVTNAINALQIFLIKKKHCVPAPLPSMGKKNNFVNGLHIMLNESSVSLILLEQ